MCSVVGLVCGFLWLCVGVFLAVGWRGRLTCLFVWTCSVPECKTVCAKQNSAVLMPAVVFHHSLVYRSVTWIWPWLIMHIPFVCVNWQVRLQVLKDQVMTQSLLFQAWYLPKIKSLVLQDMENLTDWFDPCGSIETVNVKYFVHDIREKRMGWNPLMPSTVLHSLK